MEKKQYYLGLDMGTNSVGWAVTDSSYNLISKKGKDLWGIREFDEAKTSAERRTKRISRRRHQRSQVRIGLLREYFADEIEKNDELFYLRMENSKYFPKDKDMRLQSTNGIFDDDSYKDADYYNDYPTIFHLRKALIEDSVPFNEQYCRKVYLALLNMFKHRGHFLNASLSDRDEIIAIAEIYPRFVDLVDELLDLSFPVDVASELEDILADRSKSRSAKSDALMDCCNFSKTNKKEQLIIKCLCGLKVDGKKLFDDLETEDKIDICFSDFAYEEKAEDVETALGQEYFELVDVMKQIFDAGQLSAVMHGYTYLSFARVDSYKKHEKDLKILKNIYRSKTEDEYNAMFRDPVAGSYSAYVNTTNSDEIEGKKVRRSMGGRTRDELYKKIKAALKNDTSAEAKYVLDEIEKESFLPKQLTPGNGIIPNQIHKMEMVAILKNAEKYLSFLCEKDESGLTVSERIVKLFTYQIPYYIGPTSEKSEQTGGNGWVVRKETGQVLPWNFDEKIDVEKTQEEFIKRLIRSCTYLQGEKVLPKASLEYEAYCVLNEINNLKIDGEKVDIALKQSIYNDLFCRKNRVTKKNIVTYLIGQGAIKDESQLSGIDVNINNCLTSYNKFYGVFGESIREDKYKHIAERIIELSTIYGDSKKTLKKVIQLEFGNDLKDQQLKRILGFKFKDWGRLSKAFLELEGCEKSTGEVMSLIRAMWETNNNLMELLNSDNYTFKEELEARKYKSLQTLSEFKVEDLDEYYFSAPVRRMVWQTILIIKEIEKIMEGAPDRVFIEMTRSDEEKGDKGRKDSRSKQLIELYKNIKGETREWSKEIETAGESGILRSKKMYLYYTQMGKCMYTGENIDLDRLFSTDYDIDHIYPRHYVKDDNLSNNLVLVKKESNAYKSDNYPLPQMKPEVYDLWKRLHSNNLISDEKYRRLTGRNPFTDEQKAGFIARQLVETSQGTKGIADLLKQLLPEDSKIVYAKGRNVSDFRRDRNYLKSRALNDMHHAKDAYLNIVVGNVYYTKFTQNPLNFIKNELAFDEKRYHYNLGRMYDWKVERNGVVAWEPGSKGTMATVDKVMLKNTPLLTRMTFEAKGAIANETLYSAKKAKKDNYIPLKTTDARMLDVTKYGGFTKVFGAYFFLVEHGPENKRIRTLEMVPIYLKKRIESYDDGLLDYCKNDLNLNNPRICLKKIKMQSLISLNGFKVRLSARTGNRVVLRNEVQLCLNQRWNNYIHFIEKYVKGQQISEKIDSEKNVQLYDELTNKHLNEIFAKRQNPIGEKLQNGRTKFLGLSLENQAKILFQILQLSTTGTSTADLSEIGGAPTSGKMRYNKNIVDAIECDLICQSVTGVFENRINLLKI